jgi:manganese oxidase
VLYSINSLIEGNSPLLTMKRGKRVRWYLLSNSNQDGVHIVHAGTGKPYPPYADGYSSAKGRIWQLPTWFPTTNELTLSFHVNDHLIGGMQALFKVLC